MSINSKAILKEGLDWFFEKLRGVRAFSVLSNKELAQLASKMRSYEFQAGTTLVNQGESANLFFIVQKGLLEVSVKKYFFKKRRVALLEAGDFFGESVLVSNSKRTATVTAVTDVACFVLLKPSFKSLLKQNYLFKENMKAVFSGRKAILKKA